MFFQFVHAVITETIILETEGLIKKTNYVLQFWNMGAAYNEDYFALSSH